MARQLASLAKEEEKKNQNVRCSQFGNSFPEVGIKYMIHFTVLYGNEYGSGYSGPAVTPVAEQTSGIRHLTLFHRDTKYAPYRGHFHLAPDMRQGTGQIVSSPRRAKSNSGRRHPTPRTFRQVDDIDARTVLEPPDSCSALTPGSRA